MSRMQDHAAPLERASRPTRLSISSVLTALGATAVLLSPALGQAQVGQIPIIEERQVLTPAASDTDARGFGVHIAVDGNTALVGIPQTGSGSVAVYRRRAGVWTRTDTLVNTDPRPAGQFGFGVALDRDVALIVSGGFMHVLRRSNGVWRQTQTLDAPPSETFALENGVIALKVGGQIAIYQENADGMFQRTATVLSPHSSDDRMWVALSPAAHWLVVGVPSDNELRGAAYVFRRVGSSWVEHQTLIAIDGEPGDRFGASLAIDNRTIVIGSDADRPRRGVGAAYVFRRHARFWHEQRKLEPATAAGGRGFTPDVALSSRFVIVSIPSQDPGAVFLYKRNGNFDEPDFALVGDPFNVLFGETVDVSGRTLLVGSRDNRNVFSGFVYAYRLRH